MTVLVVNDGIIKSISILIAVIRPMIKFDVDKLQDCFWQEVKWTLAIRYQLLTLSALDLNFVHHLPHTLLLEKILIVCQKGINEFQMLRRWFKAVEIIKLCNVVPYWLNEMGFNLINLCANLVSVWAWNIHRGPLIQHNSFKISFVRASNAMDQMLFCCIAVFQYVSIICQCGVSANAFAMCHIA